MQPNACFPDSCSSFTRNSALSLGGKMNNLWVVLMSSVDKGSN